MTDMETTGRRQRRGLGRIFRRGPWENVATLLIVLGVFMLMQPFSAWLYGWSFGAVLAGTLGFVVVSHFPE
ncbi:MAG: hypothetical protein RH942_09735 [Kiloniellaceae bacterium]